MSALRLATVIDVNDGIAAATTKARAHEAAGVDVFVVQEAYGIDAVSVLGYLAALCPRVELVSGILPIFSRTPALLAMTAAGLDAVSGGRFSLGIGASGAQVVQGWHGVDFDHPLARTREIMAICRRVWKREPLVNPGPEYPLPAGGGRPIKLAHRPVRDRIPILLAALGPKNVELAAAEADGWLPFPFVPERADHVWGEALAVGKARRSADLGPLEVIAGGPLAIGDDVVHLREHDREHLTRYVGGMGSREANFYTRLVAGYGWADEARAVQDLFLAGDRTGAAAALPAGLLEGTSLIGDEAYVLDRLRAHVAAGVTVLQVDPVGADAVADLRRLKELVAQL